MRLRELIAVSIFFSSPLLAFEARIVDLGGAPVRGAEVSILGQAGSARTDAEGRFVWLPDPAVPFRVLIVLPVGTYMSPVLVEALPEDGSLTIVVEPLVSESIMVAGGAAPGIDTPPGSALTAVPEEDIQERHPTRLTDVIQNVPGAGSVSDLHASVPSLRGLARGRTLLLIDGARVTTERRAGPSATFLDPFFLQGVEVSRGPGSVSYGSDAFGGVIHARTRRVAPGAPTRVRVKGAFGAGLPEVTGGVELTRGFHDGGFVVQARTRHFEPYRSPEGEVFNSQASDRGFLGRLTQRIGPGDFSVGWQTSLGRDTGRPDTRGEAVRTSYPEEDSHRLTLTYDLEPRAGFTRLGLHGFWGRYRLVTERESEPAAGRPRSRARADVTANDFSFRTFGVRPIGTARWEMGVDVNGRYGLEALDSVAVIEDGGLLAEREELAIDDARRTDAALYTSTEVLLGSGWSLGAGGRIDHVTTKNVGGFFGNRSTAKSAFSGYGSLKLELARGLSLTGQLARGFRDPTLSDRYFRGVSGRGVVTGNPELEPEHANQLDAALRFGRGPLRWAVFGYFYRFTDLIERFEVVDDRFLFRNRGRADIRGLEAEVQAELAEGLYHLDVSAQISRGTTLDDDAPLDDVPATNLKLELRRNFASRRGYGLFRISFFAEDTRPGPTEVVVPTYGTLDLGFGWRLTPKVELRGMARNLFDKAYPVSADWRAVLAPGMNAVVAIVGDF